MIINPYIFGGFDPDAQAFITAANITDNTQKTAINQLVLDLKGYNIWSKMKAIYPFVGGTASTHKWNLKDPRDLDAAFRLVFNGGWTHSSTGALPNGTNAYADTYLVPSINLSTSNSHLSFYSRTNVAAANRVSIGSFNSGFTSANQIVILNSINNFDVLIGDTSSVINVGNTISTGFYIGSRTATNLVKSYKNNSILGNNTTSVSITNPRNLYLGARNEGVAVLYDNKECAFATIGDGLTDTDATNLSWITEQYQTTLGRSVNPWYDNGNLLLDNYPSAAVAYSVRKLRNYYIGAAIRVRRSSDNAEQDIYFDSTGNLDTASLLSFVGAGNGFVTRWYDQSGNGNNATQTTAANQPRIVNAGILELNANNKPAVRFIDSNSGTIQHSLIMPVWHTASQSYVGVFSIYQLNNNGTFPCILNQANSINQGFIIQHNSNTRQVRTATVRSILTDTNGNTLNLNELYLRYDLANRINMQTYLNGSSIPTINIADNNSNFIMPTNYYIGNSGFALVTQDTPISEFITYTTDQTSNKSGIETNIKTYYTIP